MARDWLLARQDGAGFWAGMLESNCCIEAEWLLAFHLLGIAHPQTGRIVAGLLQRQRGDGAWEVYFDAPAGDINATVECYLALRAQGLAPDAAPLRRAREWIFAHGGLPATRAFTRYWLALLGEWPWESTPNLPPEIIVLPQGSPVSIGRFAAWARATLVPLAVLSARRPVKRLPAQCRPEELFPQGRDAMDYRLPRRGSGMAAAAFRAGDQLLHFLQRRGWIPGRERAITRCIDWILRHQDGDGTWGGIQPPWIYGLLALHSEGMSVGDPVLRAGIAALDKHWSYERDGSLRIQASESSVWDTALAAHALLDAGVGIGQSPALQKAVQWLLDREVRVPGDWSEYLPQLPPGGCWAFQRANERYPDVDDTALVLLLLVRCRGQGLGGPGLEAAIGRARHWLLAMQCRNGGWAAFDRDNDSLLLTQIPFCDFGEAIDPPSADVTAHVIEALAAAGIGKDHPAMARALEFICNEQEPQGSWFGRWGVNHIYGTAAVLQALRASGVDMDEAWVRRAAGWLASCQQPDGGWGESCASYADPAWIGRGTATASQSAWALMGLIAAHPGAWRGAIAAGVAWLVRNQQQGTWGEHHYTGTGFPGYGAGARLGARDLRQRGDAGSGLSRGFMLNYNLYRHYFPLAALGRAARAGF